MSLIGYLIQKYIKKIIQVSNKNWYNIKENGAKKRLRNSLLAHNFFYWNMLIFTSLVYKRIVWWTGTYVKNIAIYSYFPLKVIMLNYKYALGQAITSINEFNNILIYENIYLVYLNTFSSFITHLYHQYYYYHE